jgi:hypothetical protein
MRIRVEVMQVTQGEEWRELESVGQDLMGSFTDTTHGRDVLLFGWRDGQVGVWRSEGGYDQELAGLRGVTSLGLELLSDLREPYERTVAPEGGGLARVRWTLVR